MADAVQIEMGRQKLLKNLKTMERRVFPATKKGFESWSINALNIFKGRRLNGPPGVGERTGDLRRSFRQRVTGNQLTNVEALFTTRSKYAALHEYGGTVKPKKAKMLAIPLPGTPALIEDKRARYASPLRESLPKNIRFAVVRSKKGNLLLFGKAPGEEARPWYLLRKSVKIKPRLEFGKTIKREHKRLIENMRKRYKNIFEQGRPG